ncbi:hypothetical protein ACEN8K_37045, partial [Variovorax sp. CT11-76]
MVASDGGLIYLSSFNGLFLDGTLRAGAHHDEVVGAHRAGGIGVVAPADLDAAAVADQAVAPAAHVGRDAGLARHVEHRMVVEPDRAVVALRRGAVEAIAEVRHLDAPARRAQRAVDGDLPVAGERDGAAGIDLHARVAAHVQRRERAVAPAGRELQVGALALRQQALGRVLGVFGRQPALEHAGGVGARG